MSDDWVDFSAPSGAKMIAEQARLNDIRSREWIGGRFARDWLMEEWQCADFTADQALCRVAGSSVPAKISKVGVLIIEDGDREKISSYENFVSPNDGLPITTGAIQQAFALYPLNDQCTKCDLDWHQGYLSLRLFDFVVDPFSEERKEYILRQQTTLEGIRLHTASLIEHFDLYVPAGGAASSAPLAESSLQPKAANLGGKPAAKHGDAIASATLRLANLTPAEFGRYTVASLARELEADYRSLGETPPSERNRETYAAGILRVLRARAI